jgi:hypothetical protein
MEKEITIKLNDIDRRVTRIESVHHATVTIPKAK